MMEILRHADDRVVELQRHADEGEIDDEYHRAHHQEEHPKPRALAEASDDQGKVQQPQANRRQDVNDFTILGVTKLENVKSKSEARKPLDD